MIFEAFSDVSLERLVLAFLDRFPIWFRLCFRFSFEACEKGADAWYTVKTNGFSAIPPPLPTGMKLNAFKQQPVVCEVVDMSLSQPGEEYE